MNSLSIPSPNGFVGGADIDALRARNQTLSAPRVELKAIYTRFAGEFS
jgi:hypothetical protein